MPKCITDVNLRISTDNMKYAIDWCVFAWPDNTDITPANTNCAQVCAGPENSVKISLTDRLSANNRTLQYEYCDTPNINNSFDACADCLNAAPNAKALANCKFRTQFDSAELMKYQMSRH